MQLIFAGNDTEGLRYGTIQTPEKYYLTWKEAKTPKDESRIMIFFRSVTCAQVDFGLTLGQEFEL